MGPTACGKTALSLNLAKRLNAEIVSVDSALVYRGMDVGTAKPSTQERCAVPHHLIDICEPWEAYSAARFCDDAMTAIEQIHQRGAHALLAGGTMLYFKALEEGLAELPEANQQLRSSMLEEAASLGWPAMHAQLAQVDAIAAARIHPNDPQRIQRAMEVYRLTGVPMSQLQAQTTSRLSVPPVKFALIPEDRAWLHRRIEQRFDMMIDDGFMQEMQQLRAHSKITAQLPAMRSVGYRQAWDYLDGLTAIDDVRAVNTAAENTFENAWTDKAIAATRQLAKRQMTWLRSMKGVTSVACDKLSVEEQARKILALMAAAD